jgi:hypothetical protein
MASVSADIHKNRPLLGAGHGNLQNSPRHDRCSFDAGDQDLLHSTFTQPQAASLLLHASNHFLSHNATEDMTQQEHVSSNGTLNSEQHSYPCLEQLLMIHPPVDLGDEVEIPDYRNPAKGGLADVYAGTYNGTRVCSVSFDCPFLCSSYSGRRQSIQDKQGPGRSHGSIQQTGGWSLHLYAQNQGSHRIYSVLGERWTSGLP